MFTALLTAALISIDPVTAVATEAATPPDSISVDECTSTCLSSLEDESAALQCYVQCLVMAPEQTDKTPVDAPDWMPMNDEAPPHPVDHSFCLDACEETSDTANALATCRLNCANTWSVLTTEPANCQGEDADQFSELCADPMTSACERGCFVNSVTCTEACAEAEDDKRPTDIASCELRCRNLADMCRNSCETDNPDAFTTIDEPGC